MAINARAVDSIKLNGFEPMSNATNLVAATEVASRLLPGAPDSWLEIVGSALEEIAATCHENELVQPTIDASLLIDQVVKSSNRADIADALVRPLFFCKWNLSTFKRADPGFSLKMLGFLR